MITPDAGVRAGRDAIAKWRHTAVALLIIFAAWDAARAQSMKEAAAIAVANNPAFAARRSAYLATREKLPQAFAGYLPRVSATADVGYLGQAGDIPSFGVNEPYYRTTPRGVGLQLTQTLFNGFKTPNSVAQAQDQIGAASATLDDAEQATIFAVASAYVAVLRDRTLLALAGENIEFFRHEFHLVDGRHMFGDVTATDLALARSRLAGARLRFDAAQAVERGSAALYRATTGTEPERLTDPTLVDALVPSRFDAALDLALRNHPMLRAAQKTVDAAERAVKVAEADYLPTASVSISASRRNDVVFRGDSATSGSVIGQLSIPIFDGGLTSSKTSEARQIVSQRELELDSSRNDVRSAVQVAWSRSIAARSELTSAEAQVKAARTALFGMVQEFLLGERTTIDVLNSQQDYATARKSLVEARAERVLASYALARAVGVLTLPKFEASRGDAIAISAISGVPIDLSSKLPLDDTSKPIPLAHASLEVGRGWTLRLEGR